MPSKLKSKKLSSPNAKHHNRNQSLKSTSSKRKIGSVSRGLKVKNKPRRFKVAQTVTKSGVPILKRKIKAEIS